MMPFPDRLLRADQARAELLPSLNLSQDIAQAHGAGDWLSLGRLAGRFGVWEGNVSELHDIVPTGTYKEAWPMARFALMMSPELGVEEMDRWAI